MRYILCSLLVPVCLGLIPNSLLAASSKSQSKPNQIDSSRLKASFDTSTKQILQDQINLATRLERALQGVDANRVRAMRGQVLINATNIEAKLRRKYPQYRRTCTAQNLLTENTQEQIYCSIYAASQEMLSLAPILDRIVSRRGENAIVRRLPLHSGEYHSDPVLSIAPMQKPQLNKRATPFIMNEPSFIPGNTTVIGNPQKTAVADYKPPIQPAVAPPIDALKILARAEKHITQARILFPAGEKFHDPRETNAALDGFTYGLDPQEPQTYAEFLKLPNTGIFRALPIQAYQRPRNILQNRLDESVSDRYPFPVIGQTDNNFTPTFALKLVNPSPNQSQKHFQVIPQGIDYSFMADLGDIPIAEIDPSLKRLPKNIRTAFLDYQPPEKLGQIQAEGRRIFARKHENSLLSSNLPAGIDRTYLVRVFQYQLPPEIMENRFLTRQQRLHIDAILEKTASSDTILVFRPVRQRRDGSYTILWRVLSRLPNPVVEDLEAYLQY